MHEQTPGARPIVPDRNHTCSLPHNNCAEHIPELRDLLGHDGLGHRLASRLAHQGITTREALLEVPPAVILDWRQVGNSGLKRLHERGLVGEGPGRRALIYYVTVGDRLTETALDQLQALTAFTRAQGWQIVGAVLDSRHLDPTPRWGKAVRELRAGHLDNIVVWDSTTGGPSIWIDNLLPRTAGNLS